MSFDEIKLEISLMFFEFRLVFLALFSTKKFNKGLDTKEDTPSKPIDQGLGHSWCFEFDRINEIDSLGDLSVLWIQDAGG